MKEAAAHTFLNFQPLGISPHKGGMCLLGSVKEKEDIHAETYEEGEALVSEILSERVDVSLEDDYVGPFLRSFKSQLDNSPEEGSFGHLSHEQMTEYTGDCRAFYDPISEYMERLGNGNEWSHLYSKDQFICYFLLPLCISFMFINHKKETKLLGKMLDWLHWNCDFT